MIKNFIFFHISLIILLLSAFFVHVKFFEKAMLIELYFLNALAAALVYWIIYTLKDKHKEYTGFCFLFGTTIKFIAFFAYALPTFKDDGDVSRQEFFSFFIPYLICLFIETTALISLLKNTNTERIKK